jgi:hypothetical protein
MKHITRTSDDAELVPYHVHPPSITFAAVIVLSFVGSYSVIQLAYGVSVDDLTFIFVIKIAGWFFEYLSCGKI